VANNNGEGRAYTRVYYSDWRQGEWIRLEGNWGNGSFYRQLYMKYCPRRKPVEILKLTLKRKEPREYK